MFNFDININYETLSGWKPCHDLTERLTSNL